MRLPVSIERTAWRSPARSRPARMSVRSPGAGSSTSVRSVCSARRSLRYWTSSAWQRRQLSTWRRASRSSWSEPSATSERRSAIWSHCTGTTLLLDRLSPQGVEVLAELAAGSVQTHLRRRLGDAQLGGDGLVGQVVDVAEHDHGPQAGGQLTQGRVEAIPEGGRLRACLGVDVGVRVRDRRVVEELLVAVAGALA